MPPPIRPSDGYQKLYQHVAFGADRHAETDSRVRSVTETSMMFMIPMPRRWRDARDAG